MRLGDLRGKELIDRAAAEHLGVVYHVDGMLDETTGKLVNLELMARRGLFGARQAIPWGAVEKVGREIVIVNLASAHEAPVPAVQPPAVPPPLAGPWPHAVPPPRRRRRLAR